MNIEQLLILRDNKVTELNQLGNRPVYTVCVSASLTKYAKLWEAKHIKLCLFVKVLIDLN